MIDHLVDSTANERISCLDSVLDKIENTTDRGIHVLDEETGKINFASYADILLCARRLATRLSEHGIGNGDYVLFSAKTTQHFAKIWLALQWMGAIPVPMPPREALLGQYTFKQRLSGIIPHFRYYLCTQDEFKEILIIDRPDSQLKVIEQNRLLHNLDTTAPHNERHRHNNNAPAFVQFTSGSTNHPKGILVTHSNVFANIYSVWNRLAVDPQQHSAISWLPLYHDMGLVGKFLTSLYTQTNLVLMSPQHFAKHPLKFLELITRFQPKICSMPNFALEWIMRRLKVAKNPHYDLSSVTWFGIGGEPIDPDIVRSIHDALSKFGLTREAISPSYGLAEATLAVTLSHPEMPYNITRHQGREVMHVGSLVQDMEVKIDAIPGEAGRILVRGPSIAREALIDGKRTSILDDQGFYDTKDIGYFQSGELVVLGRADEAFIRNGENRFPYDIEAVVRKIDGVLRNRVVCFGVPKTDSHGVEIVILVESKPLTKDEHTTLAAKVEAQVVRYHGLRVDRVLAVPPKFIPVTPSGKLQRQRARMLYREGLYETPKDNAPHNLM